MKWKGLVFAILSFIVIGVPYLDGVDKRNGAHDCRRQNEGGLYIGEICFLPYANGTLFRLYDSETGELLAERTYSDLDPSVVFGEDRVYYNMGATSEGYVMLPPTWLDRFRAKLP